MITVRVKAEYGKKKINVKTYIMNLDEGLV